MPSEPETVIRWYSLAVKEKDYDRRDWLFPEIIRMVSDTQLPPESLTALADVFLWQSSQEVYDNFGDMFWLADSGMTSLLKNPACPVNVLAEACRSNNSYYAYIAAQHPTCSEEDKVYAVLNMTLPSWFEEGLADGYWKKHGGEE
jgi:hypothetical protein